MLPEKELTDSEIVEKGNKAIIKELGIAGYIRYLRLQRPNNDGRDYLKIRDEVVKDISLKDVIKWSSES